MKNIEVTDYTGVKYEGKWNEKTYKSTVSDRPELYRIYVNEQLIHVTEEEYQRMIGGAGEYEKKKIREAVDRRRKDIETMSLYEKADVLMTIFRTGFGNKKDGLGDAFSSTALGSSYVRSLAKQLGKDPERVSSDITKFIEKTVVALYKEAESKELQVKANESFENVVERLLRYQDMPETYYVSYNGVKLNSKDTFDLNDATKKVFGMSYKEWKNQSEE
nr:MAG TPA: Protein of unknown function (DUF1244) [Caudoviricetes sp.]